MAESSGVAVRAAREACQGCGGTGWQIIDDGGNGAARPCACRDAVVVQELMARAGIPHRHRRCRLDNFETQSAPDAGVRGQLALARSRSEHYVERFVDLDTRRFRSTGLLYMGPPGTGKTHLATAVLTALIERYRVRGAFVNFSHLVYQLQATFDPSATETRRQILDPITRAEVLVLDELGATKPTDWVQDQLYHVINARYTSELPTIFTTNFRTGDGAERPRATGGPPPVTDAAVAGATPGRRRTAAAGGEGAAGNPFAQLDARIAPMLVSRLYEMTQPIVLGSWDYRQQVMLPRRRSGS